ncbi:Uridine 5'-monophosphate synthase, partial [Operophtera brumata]
KMTSFDLTQLAVQLFDAGAVRIGDIEAKMAVAKQLQLLAQEINHELLCGVPYAALPLAAVMSVNANTPMIMRRKETKLYATKKLLEGIYEKHQTCLVVEDVVTSGGSLLETINTLREEGLSVSHAVVVLDRGQGGVSVLKANGVIVKSLFTLSGLVKILNNVGRINDETVEIILEHIKECQFATKDNLTPY